MKNVGKHTSDLPGLENNVLAKMNFFVRDDFIMVFLKDEVAFPTITSIGT